MNYYLVAQITLKIPRYIEASCSEEARNVYIAMRSMSSNNMQFHNTDAQVYGIAQSDTLQMWNTIPRVSFNDRPEELKKKPRYHGLTSYVDAQYFHISERQWDYIESLCLICDTIFTGITRIDAAKFIDDHADEAEALADKPSFYYND